MSSSDKIKILGILIAILVIAYILLVKSIKKRKGLIVANNSKASLKGIFWLYRFFSQTPVLKRYYKKIKTHLEVNYPADEMSVRRKATLTMAKCFGLCLAIIVFVIAISKGDCFFICMGVFMTYFAFTYLITNSQEKLDGKLINQLGTFITDIRHYYSSQSAVEDAIYDTLDETPYEMGLHATKIYKILTSTDVKQEVDKYTDVAPNKYILTLVSICSSIKEYGDKPLEDGQSLFLKNLGYLKKEINIELLRRKRNAFLFSGLIALTLIPLFFLKAIESWCITNVPEMENFYRGNAGTIVMAAIFIITVLIYQLVANLKDGHSEDTKDHKLINKILTIPIVNKLVTLEINRHYTKHLRIDDGLKMVGDRIGVKGFLLKRVLLGIFSVILVLVVIFTAEYRSRYNILNDFSESFESSLVPDEEYRQIMRQAAFDHTLICLDVPDTEENRAFIAAEIEKRGIATKFAREVADEVFLRVAQYKNVFFQWWFMLILIAGYVAGYYIPYLILLYKLGIVKMDMEDEVIQYQTIVLILMHVDGIMIDTVLEWMERFSYCFRQSIQECIINLEYSTQKALLKMKNQESFPPFRRFVDNLLMVESEDILTAFSEIETDREYYEDKRKEDNEIIMTKKAEIGKMIAFIPLFATLLGYLIAPFAVYAINMLSEIGI